MKKEPEYCKCDICGSEKGVKTNYYRGRVIGTIELQKNNPTEIYSELETLEGGCCKKCDILARFKASFKWLGSAVVIVLVAIAQMLMIKGFEGWVTLWVIGVIAWLVMAIISPFRKAKDGALADYYNKKLYQEKKIEKSKETENKEEDKYPIEYLCKSEYDTAVENNKKYLPAFEEKYGKKFWESEKSAESEKTQESDDTSNGEQKPEVSGHSSEQ